MFIFGFISYTFYFITIRRIDLFPQTQFRVYFDNSFEVSWIMISIFILTLSSQTTSIASTPISLCMKGENHIVW